MILGDLVATLVGAIHEAAVLFGGSLRIKKPTR